LFSIAPPLCENNQNEHNNYTQNAQLIMTKIDIKPLSTRESHKFQAHQRIMHKALAKEQRKTEERKARALAEQKRKQELFEEHKQKLQKEIDDHNLKLEEQKRETGREIERLRKERETLGFLAMGKKKEIDQKILSRKKQLSDSGAKIDLLRSQLRNLKP